MQKIAEKPEDMYNYSTNRYDWIPLVLLMAAVQVFVLLFGIYEILLYGILQVVRLFKWIDSLILCVWICILKVWNSVNGRFIIALGILCTMAILLLIYCMYIDHFPYGPH